MFLTKVLECSLGKCIFKLIPTISLLSSQRGKYLSVRDKFKEELQRLDRIKVIALVDQPTEWVIQIVVAVKKPGELCVCFDPKALNTALTREHYQIPVNDDLLHDLTDARVFTKVDLASAFWHLELDEESSMLTSFAMPYG